MNVENGKIYPDDITDAKKFEEVSGIKVTDLLPSLDADGGVHIDKLMASDSQFWSIWDTFLALAKAPADKWDEVSIAVADIGCQ